MDQNEQTAHPPRKIRRDKSKWIAFMESSDENQDGAYFIEKETRTELQKALNADEGKVLKIVRGNFYEHKAQTVIQVR